MLFPWSSQMSYIYNSAGWLEKHLSGKSAPTESQDVYCSIEYCYSRMRSEGSRFTWGSGGEAVFAKFCVCDRNRRQPSAVTP